MAEVQDKRTAEEIVADADKVFVLTWEDLSETVHTIALEKGWWDEEREDGTCIALMHSELSEGLEGLRKGNPQSDHIPEFNCAEEEMADTIIRIMDFAKRRKLRVAEAILAKVKFNQTRPHKHGGKKF